MLVGDERRGSGRGESGHAEEWQDAFTEWEERKIC